MTPLPPPPKPSAGRRQPAIHLPHRPHLPDLPHILPNLHLPHLGVGRVIRWVHHRQPSKVMAQGHHLHEDDRLIDLKGVVKRYDTAAGSFTALKNVDLHVGASEFVAIIGKSGSGKSTLINMLTGIDRPTSGEVWVADTPVHTLSEGQLAKWRGKNVGVVFQFFQLLPTLTLLENVVLPMEFCKLYTRRERRERALHLLDRVGLADRADKRPSEISGGQQQRVAIARALANDPSVIVADEPTGNLDSKMAEAIFRLFEELVHAGKTIIMVTHDNHLASRATRSVIVADGEIVNQYVAEALHALDVDHLSLAAAHLKPVQYAPGSVIVRQGAPADAFYIVTKGEVEVHLLDAHGHDILVNHMGHGHYFGEAALLQNVPQPATVRAAADCEVEVMELDRETFMNLIEDSEVTRHEFEAAVHQEIAQMAAAAEAQAAAEAGASRPQN